MASNIPSGPSVTSVPVPADSSFWDRVSTWVSENKAIVYTIAGVAVVVTGAGAVYYIKSGSVSLLRHRGPGLRLRARSQPVAIH
jgi:mitochondrial import receptor subunit TOM70